MSLTPSDSGQSALHDIAYHIALVDSFIGNLSLSQFAEDLKTIYASVRCLEIISEASRRLPADVKERHPAIDWQRMAGAGNIYRHDYEDVEARQVWKTVAEALPPLRKAIESEISGIK